MMLTWSARIYLQNFKTASPVHPFISFNNKIVCKNIHYLRAIHVRTSPGPVFQSYKPQQRAN